ncbi:hypothetical protein L6164_010016 [Bauhinia variegata]|uniref:Uncharacterized protein n=1 Tax=Bauhinia variegata TaxID=167791 RepID=A0ACB9PPG2_BAUVA|nr:hypothetical protein L6164_010016 [Bauhinia variegata]
MNKEILYRFSPEIASVPLPLHPQAAEQDFYGFVKYIWWRWQQVELHLPKQRGYGGLLLFLHLQLLQAPCILCSRLEHVTGGKKPEFYKNLLCNSHRSEVSSLIACHIHGNIADGRGMCDDCLLSFTIKIKPNPKTHRLMVGKLGMVHGGFQSSSLSRDLFTGSGGPRPCTCCGKLWKSGHKAQKPLQLKSYGEDVVKSDITLPHAPTQSHLNHRDNLKNIEDKFSGSTASCCLGKSSFDPLSHVGYTELKLPSDSESEFPLSVDNDAISHDDFETHNDPVAQNTPVTPPKRHRSDSNPAKPNNSSPNALPSLLDPHVEPNISNHNGSKLLASDAANDCGLGEINWQKINQNASSDLPELISLDEISPSPNVVNIYNGQSEERDINSCLSQNSPPAALSEFMTLDGTHSYVGATQEKSIDDDRTRDIGLESIKTHEGDSMITTRAAASVETDLIVNDSALVSLTHDNSGKTSEFPVTGKEREVPSAVVEQSTAQEVDRIKEEQKPSQSHQSSPRMSILSSTNPVSHIPYTEMQADASSSNGTQVLQRSASVESGLESLDESNVGEVEGESIGDGYRRQLEYTKKCLSSLQKELEEERNASAIAANQAMAMITRLQEEKASLHMEALQYLRMMEEQAEYDVDALEKANDLLAEKEKEIQDLEAELEFYKTYVADEPMEENIHGGNFDLKQEKVSLQNACVPHVSKNVNNSSNPKTSELYKGSVETVVDEFEEEKLYISECLKSLKMALQQISSTGVSSDKLDCTPEKFEDHKSDQNSSCNGGEPPLGGRAEETDMSIHKSYHTSNGRLTDENGSVASDNDDCSLSKENNHFKSVGPKNTNYKTEVDMVALENQVPDLHDRLGALEVDHDLLERMLNSLRNGKDGLQFIQEIAHQLFELQKIVLKFRWFHALVCQMIVKNQDRDLSSECFECKKRRNFAVPSFMDASNMYLLFVMLTESWEGE